TTPRTAGEGGERSEPGGACAVSIGHKPHPPPSAAALPLRGRDYTRAAMQRSTERILTTHVGSLPRPPDLLDEVMARTQGKPAEATGYAVRLCAAVKEVVRKQIELGIDVIDDGEFGKSSFVAYVNERLGGFEIDKGAPRQIPWAQSRE